MVDIITPPNQRLELVEQFSKYGKHILMEKPIERNLSNAKEIEIRSSSKNKEIFYTIESEMINTLSNSNNLSIFKPKIKINNKDSYLVKLSANKGVFFFESNQFDLSEKINVNLIKDKEKIELFAEKVFVDIDKEYLMFVFIYSW